jgi:hypothetical protein
MYVCVWVLKECISVVCARAAMNHFFCIINYNCTNYDSQDDKDQHGPVSVGTGGCFFTLFSRRRFTTDNSPFLIDVD